MIVVKETPVFTYDTIKLEQIYSVDVPMNSHLYFPAKVITLNLN